MPLRKSPLRTPALLAANRANAQDCRGPRSPQGKARVALNALQQGRYAVRLRENLVRAGEGSAESQYQRFRSEIAAAFGARGHDEELQAERMAARACCTAPILSGHGERGDGFGNKAGMCPGISR